MSTEAPSPFATVEEAIEDIRAGRFVVVVDDEDRENEGDLVIAAEFVTPEAVNFMATHGRGLICLCLTPDVRRAGPPPDDRAERDAVRHRVHRLDRGSRGRHDRISATTAPIRSRSRSTRPRGRTTSSTRPRLPAARPGGRRPSARARPRPRSTSRGLPASARRGHLRDHERGRDDGARGGPGRLLRAPRLTMITVADLIEHRRQTRSSSSASSRCGCRPSTATSRRSPTRRSDGEAPRRPRQGDVTAPRTCSSASTPSA